MLEITNLKKRFKDREVVRKVSIKIEQGEVVGLLGPNGAGKTACFYMIVGLIAPFKGNVFLDSINITQLPMYKRARLGIGYLSQEPSVFRNMTVKDNLLSVLEMTMLNKKEQHQKCEDVGQRLIGQIVNVYA